VGGRIRGVVGGTCNRVGETVAVKADLVTTMFETASTSR
jgi:hypothetical protein